MKYILLIAFCGFASILRTQSDTLLFLDTLTIEESALRQYQTGSTTQTWTKEALAKAQNLSELLSREANIFIKNYGPGTLSTSATRGGSAGHTLVLWNDLPIQSPMLGLLDLSLINVGGADAVTFQRGGSSALWGSGAVSGSVSLRNQRPAREGFTLNSQSLGGAFGAWSQHTGLSWAKQKIALKTSYSFRRAENDFPYRLTNGETRRLTNARQTVHHWRQDAYFTINPTQQFSLHYWGLQAARQIPPTTTQRSSEARQQDRAHRLALRWRYSGARSVVKTTLGYLHEGLDFSDPATLTDSRSRFTTLLGDVAWTQTLGQRHRLLLGSTQSYTSIQSGGNYASNPSEWRSALLATYRYQTTGLNLQLNTRAEWLDGHALPLLPSMGLEFQLRPELQLKAQLSRNYRLPTFNDRYWIPGGNPDLQPESGWSQEAGLVFRSGQEPHSWKASITAFHRLIRNWIQWSPTADSPFWSAYNLTEVRSQGLEPRLQYTYTRQGFQVEVHTGYDYISSTNLTAIERPNLPAGRQLWYTPEHQGFAGIGLALGRWELDYRHQWTGAFRGQTDQLEGYQIGDLRIARSWERPGWKGTGFIQLFNLGNTDYRIIERRPMPGRHLQMGINLSFHQ